jgi:cytoplasmic iron level regulating protein YaaA (DUF328/UPF0246 family)
MDIYDWVKWASIFLTIISTYFGLLRPLVPLLFLKLKFKDKVHCDTIK